MGAQSAKEILLSKLSDDKALLGLSNLTLVGATLTACLSTVKVLLLIVFYLEETRKGITLAVADIDSELPFVCIGVLF